jgi:large subunit ribosomal protein L21
MYAVIKAGGKQHKVKAGDIIEVEYMHGVEEDAVTFRPLLVVDDDGKTHVGKALERALVTAKPAGEHKGDKVRIFKYKNKTGYARKQGHRQLMTLLEISDVNLGTESVRGSAPSNADEAADAKAAPAE